MFGTQHLAVFVVSGLLLNLTPGQDTLYIVGSSVAQGRRAGLLSVLGITSGTTIHTLAAAFGLSAILATSAVSLSIVKLLGASYLVYLGLKLLLERPSVATEVEAARGARESGCGLPGGAAHEPAEPEGGAGLHGVPATVRRADDRLSIGLGRRLAVSR